MRINLSKECFTCESGEEWPSCYLILLGGGVGLYVIGHLADSDIAEKLGIVVAIGGALGLAYCKFIKGKIGGPQKECETDADCGPGEKCINGRCVRVERECETDEDCDPGEVCIDGRCVAIGGECETDEDCGDPSRWRCINGRCRAIECETDEDCIEKYGRGYKCVNFRCKRETECRTDEDCESLYGPGYFCDRRQNRCLRKECEDDSDCPEGYSCVEYRCRKMDGCHTHADCGPNYRCLGNECYPCGSPCDTHSDCAPNERCIDGCCIEEDVANLCHEKRGVCVGTCQQPNYRCIKTSRGCECVEFCHKEGDTCVGQCMEGYECVKVKDECKCVATSELYQFLPEVG